MKFNLSEVEKAYIAGFFDGEGHISISKKKPKPPRWKNPSYKLVAIITNTDKSVLNFIKSKFEIGKIYGPYRSSGFKPNGKPLYQLHFTGKNCKKFLKAIFPYLCVKRERAALALAFPLLDRRTCPNQGLIPSQIQKRERFYQTMKLLNKKGVD